MKRIEPPTNDELRPEYDLGSAGTVRLEPEMAEVFPDADSLVANVSDESY